VIDILVHKYVFEPIGGAVCRLLFPVRSDSWQAPDDYQQIIAAAESFDKSVTLRGMLVTALTFIGILALLSAWPILMHGQPEDPIYQDHEYVQLILIAAGWSAFANRCCLPSIAARYWGTRLNDYYRCTSQIRSYDRRRAQRFGFVCAALFLPLASALLWTEGTVIDARGIRFHSFLKKPRLEPYNRVLSIGVYQEYDDLFVMQPGYNLQIAFKDGPPFELVASEADRRPEVLDSIAAYVSARSNIPTDRGRRRPLRGEPRP
jgi:hypothetical protein